MRQAPAPADNTPCLTGEGLLDDTSLAGKAVGGILARAEAVGVPCHAIVGGCSLAATERDRFASIAVARTVEEIARAAAALVAE